MLTQLIFIFCLCLDHMADAQCQIDICQMVLDDPLLIKVGRNEFYEPNNIRPGPPTVFLQKDEEIELHCVHKFLNFDVKQIKVKCHNNNYEVSAFETHDFCYFKCSQNNIADVDHPGPYKKIGYQTSKFIPLMKVYHDRNSFSNLWVSSSIDEHRCPRNYLTNIEKKNPNNIIFKLQDPNKFDFYLKANVKPLLNGLLGTHDYFLNGNFINKGHLSASSDHSHIAKQVATYSYYNVMPQWSNFNGGNWNSIEEDVRTLVDRRLSIHVITGVFGDLLLEGTLSNGQKVAKEIFLDNARKEIPIRRYFYKIVIDKSQPRSVVIVGLNDIKILRGQNFNNVCTKQITNQITWLRKTSQNDAKKGLFFACEVDDFLDKVKLLMGNKFAALENEIAKYGSNLPLLDKIKP